VVQSSCSSFPEVRSHLNRCCVHASALCRRCCFVCPCYNGLVWRLRLFLVPCAAVLVS
jgi:hypothetical protein